MKRLLCLLFCLLLPACAMALEKGDTVSFGRYPQSDPTGTVSDPIVWRVLKVEDDRALLLSGCALEVMKWHYVDTELSWEQSTVRAWLNGYERDAAHPMTNPYDDSFLERAFTDDERARICLSVVENPRNGAASGGRDTLDSVFLLSLDEATSLMDAAARVCPNTPYTYAKNARDDKGRCSWWLRSPGNATYNAAYISFSGVVRDGGFMVHGKGICVRPALWLSLASTKEENP